ncbi:MAG: hypothetical protein U1E65_35325 [Myxococcota bacterium]
MRILALASLCALPFAIACGGGGNFPGIYQVTSANLDPNGCGTGTMTSTPTFVMVQQSSFLGVAVLSVQACTANDATTCATSVNQLFTQGLLKADGTGGVTSGSGLNGTCDMVDIYTVLTRTGDKLTITSKRSEGTIQAECDSKKFDSQRDQLTCKQQVTIEANRVGDAPKGKDNNLSL